MSRDVRVLVVGAGSIGLRHVRNLLARTSAEVVVASESLPAPHHEWPRPATLVRDWKQALESRPDVVMVCTRPSDHVAVAAAAVQCGCDVFVEKPISHTVAGVAELLTRASGQGSRVMVGYNLRFLPSLRRLKRLIDDGAIGRILDVQVCAASYLPAWRPGRDHRRTYSASRELGGGVALDLSHELDYLLWFFGRPQTVSGRSSVAGDLQIEAEDNCDAELEFPGGLKAAVHLDYLGRPPGRWCRLRGERGDVRWDLYERRLTVRTPEGIVEHTDESEFDLAATYVTEIEHLLQVVRRQAPPEVDGRQALDVLRVALAARDGVVANALWHAVEAR